SEEGQGTHHTGLVPGPIEPIQPTKRSLRCSVCVESGMTDPTADCSSNAPAVCPADHEYCLTKQTQNDDGSFTMEKHCASQSSLVSLTDTPDIKLGCATAVGGLVNYCVCQGDLCNQESLLAQAQVSGVRKPESAAKHKTPVIEPHPKAETPKSHQPAIDMPTVFLDNDEAPRVSTATASVP
ncbi:unnamed protein product, partial [Cylicocyclus nassatus]